MMKTNCLIANAKSNTKQTSWQGRIQEGADVATAPLRRSCQEKYNYLFKIRNMYWYVGRSQ